MRRGFILDGATLSLKTSNALFQDSARLGQMIFACCRRRQRYLVLASSFHTRDYCCPVSASTLILHGEEKYSEINACLKICLDTAQVPRSRELTFHSFPGFEGDDSGRVLHVISGLWP